MALCGDDDVSVLDTESYLIGIHIPPAPQYGPSRWARDFAPGGILGAELAQQPALVVRGEGLCRTLFVHAGGIKLLL